jgi:hypothetical protein
MEDLLSITPEDAAVLLRGGLVSSALLTDGELKAYDVIVKRLEAHAKLAIPPIGKDKVWSGFTFRLAKNGTQHNQCRTVVRARNKAEAVRLLDAAGERMNPTYFNRYFGGTGNREELCLAVERGVWVKDSEGWIKAKQK